MEESKQQQRRSANSILLIVLICISILLIELALSLAFNVKGLTKSSFSTLLKYNPENILHYTVWSIRFPRFLLGALLGGALAVGGCLLQAITRNPLADSEIMGVNQGAALFAVISLAAVGFKEYPFLIMTAAFIGAAVGGGVIYNLAFRGDYSSSRLVLSGMAISLFFSSLTSSVIILYENDLFQILYWMAGKLTGTTWLDLKISSWTVLPVLTICFFIARHFNILVLGEDVASGLGLNVRKIRRMAVLCIIILIGGATALAGPIGFVGLMVPHMARFLVGGDYRVMLPISALIGANLLLLADLLGQFLLFPTEVPVGIITAMLGTPFFIYLMRRKKGAAI